MLPRIVESESGVFLELQESPVVVSCHVVVEASVEEQCGRYILAHLETECVFPIHLHIVVRSVVVETGAIADVLGYLIVEVYL